jgi:hypothetical protein
MGCWESKMAEAKSRRQRAVLISITVTCLILSFLAFSINDILSPFIGRKIKSAVITNSDSLYRLSFSDIKVNIFTGKLSLKGVIISADKSRSQASAQVYSGNAKTLLITGFHPLAYLLHKKLEIENVTLIDPNVALRILKVPKEQVHNSQTLYEKISGSLKLIKVNELFLKHVRLDYFDFSKPMSSVCHLKELDLHASDLLIDSATQQDTSRVLFCSAITSRVRNVSGYTDNGIYHYSFRNARFSTTNQKLIVRGIILKPLPAADFFSKSKADRYTFDLDSLVLDHFRLGDWTSNQKLQVKKLSAFNGGISVFSNPNGILLKDDRVATFPNFFMRQLQTHFSIDTVKVAGFAVHYSEFNEDPGKVGTLGFTDINARIQNVSNETETLSHNGFCTARISTRFMDSGKVDLFFAFNMTDKVYAYNYSGHLAPMPITAVNPVLMPLSLIKIKSGQLKSLDFAIHSDQKGSRGTLHLLYNDLDVDLLNRKYHSKLINSFFASTFVIDHNNPDNSSASPRFAKIVYLRPRNYSFFKSIWETLLSGLKPCVGVGSAVKPGPDKPLSEKEQKAKEKVLKKTLKAKKKAEKEYQKRIKKQKDN